MSHKKPVGAKGKLRDRFEVIKVKCLDCGKSFEVRGQAIADLREHVGPDNCIHLRLQP